MATSMDLPFVTIQFTEKNHETYQKGTKGTHAGSGLLALNGLRNPSLASPSLRAETSLSPARHGELSGGSFPVLRQLVWESRAFMFEFYGDTQRLSTLVRCCFYAYPVLFMMEQAMKITVKLFATLRQGRFDIDTFELPSGTTVGEIVEQLRIPEREVTLIFINGRHGDVTSEVHNGDTVALFPPVGGG